MTKEDIPLQHDASGSSEEGGPGQGSTHDSRAPATAGARIPELTREEWRDRALRLQAETENYRKRQQRLAREQIMADRERLLRALLDVADELRRALQASGSDGGNLWQGVQLTYQNVMNVLRREGVEPIDAQGQPFDPLWHEAVDTVSHRSAGVTPNTVVQELQVGYRIDDRLLRPSRVIVAV